MSSCKDIIIVYANLMTGGVYFHSSNVVCHFQFEKWLRGRIRLQPSDKRGGVLRSHRFTTELRVVILTKDLFRMTADFESC
ncbi:hypothetical protein PoB_005112200 [Plakobranchus ocellatus]|uniref:Uncharacterized protein n=1 Tax=Plakobranchus ocellatus TaxID=259542 RepID=A0AAV4C016_9GAST|nr:hypothetical protein PoB_005112200 [Plakobranchus ocellatus]